MANTEGSRGVLSRRSVLRYAAFSAGLVTLSRLRLPAAASPAAPTAALRVLTPQQANVLTAIVERMVFTHEAGMPAVRETRAIETIEQALLQLDSSVREQLGWLLTIFQWGPPVLRGKIGRFTDMSPAERDDYIQSWATSRFQTRRLAFGALKNLSMLGYYSQDATWKRIHYDGPWLPRPRRTVGAE